MKSLVIPLILVSTEMSFAKRCPDFSGIYYIPVNGCVSEHTPLNTIAPLVDFLGPEDGHLVMYGEPIMIKQKGCKNIDIKFINYSPEVMSSSLIEVSLFDREVTDSKIKYMIDNDSVQQTQRQGRNSMSSAYYRKRSIRALSKRSLEVFHEEYSSRGREERSNYSDIRCELKRVNPFFQVLP